MNLKDEIKERIILSEYIGEYLSLNSHNKAICPFHQGDTDPSLSVKDQEKMWSCFGCKAGGDIFNFVMLYHKLSFNDSVKHLANYLNIDYELADYSEYYKTTSWLQSKFRQYRPTEYFRKREIDEKIIDVYKVGFIKHSIPVERRISLDILDELGVIKHSRGEYHIRYENTISFPYFRESGITGFSFKELGQSSKPYENIKNTSLFKKGDELYGLSIAKEEIKKHNCAYLVEGYFDVFRLYNQGIKNVVCTSGTSLSEKQINSLKPLCNQVILCFDGDRAGRIATIKAFGELSRLEIEPIPFDIEEGEDPDTLLLKKKNAHEVDIISFFTKYFDEDSLDLLLTSLSKVSNLEALNNYVFHLSKLYPNVSETLLKSRIHNSYKYKGKIYKSDFSYNYLAIISGWIYGEIKDYEIDRALFNKEYADAYLRLRSLKNKYGYFEIEEIKQEDKKFLSPPKLQREQLLELIKALTFSNYNIENKTIEEIIKEKRNGISEKDLF